MHIDFSKIIKEEHRLQKKEMRMIGKERIENRIECMYFVENNNLDGGSQHNRKFLASAHTISCSIMLGAPPALVVRQGPYEETYEKTR